MTIHGPCALSRQTWVNMSELNSVLRRAVVQPARRNQPDRRLHDIDWPAVLPISIVSARVTAVIRIESRMLRPSALAPKSNHSAASTLLV